MSAGSFSSDLTNCLDGSGDFLLVFAVVATTITFGSKFILDDISKFENSFSFFILK